MVGINKGRLGAMAEQADAADLKSADRKVCNSPQDIARNARKYSRAARYGGIYQWAAAMTKNDYKTIWGVTRAFLKSRDADGRTPRHH
jgi:hypothetical protein